MTVRRARGQSLTILGDLSQRTADAGVSSWERRAERGRRRPRTTCASCASATACPNEFLVLAGALLPEGAPAPRGVREAPFPPLAVRSDDLGERSPRGSRGGSPRRSAASGIVLPAVHFEAVRAALAEAVDATQRAA